MGGGGVRVLLTMPPDLHEQARHAADAAGITLSEWIRRAMVERLATTPENKETNR